MYSEIQLLEASKELFNSIKNSQDPLSLDQFLASQYRSNPQLITIPNDEGRLPISLAFKHKLTLTLKTIIDSELSPRAFNTLISQLRPDKSPLAYFSQQINPKTNHLLNENDKNYAMQVIHWLVPTFNRDESEFFSEVLLEEATQDMTDLTPLKRLIDEDFDLNTKILNQYGQDTTFIALYLERLDTNNKLNFTDLFSVRGLLINLDVFRLLDRCCCDPLKTDHYEMLDELLNFIDMIFVEKKISLTDFTCRFNKMRVCYEIDMRDYKYDHNFSFIELICKNVEKPGPFLDFLDTRPKKHRVDPKPILYSQMSQADTTVVPSIASQQQSYRF